MKKRLLLTIVTAFMLLATAGATALAPVADGPMPTCNPLTDPKCTPAQK